jgi:hypothetical protein
MLCGWRLGSIGVDGFDGINGNYWWREQLAGAGDVLGALAGGEQAIVADAVETCGQHVDEKAANELVGGAAAIVLLCILVVPASSGPSMAAD